MVSNILLLFNIGGAELFFIVLVVIMFFGSKKIPELARSLGKGMKEIKNATSEIQQEIKESTKDVTDLKKVVNVEDQVKNLMTESKTDELKEQEEEPAQPSQPNTISRSNPYQSSSETPQEK